MKTKLKDAILHYFLVTVFLALVLLFISRFAAGPLLKMYVESGIGDCRKIPILCMAPTQKIDHPEVSKEDVAEFVPYRFPAMAFFAPKGFTVVQELIKKVYYKKNRRLDNGAVIYVLTQAPGYFITLFPQVAKEGITDNYLFMKRMLHTKESDIKDIYDAFFTIMKGVFIPDLGDQNGVVMLELSMPGMRGFVNYSIGGKGNYFDCNMINDKGVFFKLYIKDMGAKLDLAKVFAIISTLAEAK